jgi:hypothetical protein
VFFGHKRILPRPKPLMDPETDRPQLQHEQACAIAEKRSAAGTIPKPAGVPPLEITEIIPGNQPKKTGLAACPFVPATGNIIGDFHVCGVISLPQVSGNTTQHGG